MTGELASASVLRLLSPKLSTQRRRLTEGRSAGRVLVLGGAGGLFWLMVFLLVFRLLRYFRAAPGVGDLLAVKLLGLILLSFLAILLLSNIITALSSFFLAKDLELLAAAPVDEVRLYAARLIETTLNSSWMMVLVLVPILSAYGAAYGGGLRYVLASVAALGCFLLLPAVLGTAVTQLLVNVFPARRARDLLALIALFGVAAVVVLFRLLRPEQLARPEGFRDLVDFIGALRTPQSPWLPSEWAAEAMLAPLSLGAVAADYFPLLLLASTAAAFVVLGAWLHGRLYHEGLSRSQEGAELRIGAGSRPSSRLERWLSLLSVRARTLVAKDIRTFFRDTTQWSQLVLLAVLVVVYTYNIKVLPIYQGETVGPLLVSIISFLNLGLAGFVLAAISARFLFPAVSLEGRTLWLLRASPLPLRALLWSKYWVGVLPLLVVALALTLTTNLMLRVHGLMLWTSLATIIMITFAVAALALGLGALFPKFDSENAAEIPTGFGGLLFMMAAITYLGAIVTLEAWPMLALERARAAGQAGAAELLFLVACFTAAAALTVGTVAWPLRVAVRRIEQLDW